MMDLQITSFVRERLRPFIQSGDLCVDATMGRGKDTLFLCRQCGETGRVIAFDIQPEALAETKKTLEVLPWKNYELYNLSHERMDERVPPGEASAVMFNLGYLPGGDHSLGTRAETTIPALEGALRLLKKGGALSLCIYSGGDTGYGEKEAVLNWLRGLDTKKYLAVVTQYYNRPNDPPIPALVIKRA